MKALRYHARGDFRVDDVPEPEVRPGTVMVDVEWCGVCGSELHEFKEGPIQVPEHAPNAVTGESVPVILGHEFAGTVSAVGDGVTRVRVGDRIAVEPLMYCMTCDTCAVGGTVALGVHRACEIDRRGGILQIVSWSSSNAVASRNIDGASTPSS